MPKYTFVILHYMAIDDTRKCINSILQNLSNKNCDIVVVDNGSKNKTGEKLKSEYKSNDQVHFLLNKKNLGFAKGNNLGFKYAKENLDPDFILVINNDTYIEQTDFLEQIEKKYTQKKFHLMGPDIISTQEGNHQNPRIETLGDKKVVQKFIRIYQLLYILTFINFDVKFEKLKKKLIPTSKLPSAIRKTKDYYLNEQWNVKLHGSAIIYSNDFIDAYDYCFYPETFIYCEESILNFIVKRDNLVTFYSPSIKIFHTEDASTDFVYKKDYKKRRFYYINFIRSGKVLIKLMNESGD